MAGFSIAVLAVFVVATLTAGAGSGRWAAAVGIAGTACGRPVHGSGVVIATGGDAVVVTAAHVVAGATRLEVVARDGSVHRALALGFDEKRDLALLRVATLRSPPARVESHGSGSGRLAVVDESGALELIPYEIERRVSANVIDEATGLEATRGALELHSVVEPGASGAGLFATGDEIVGIVWAASRHEPRRAWAVDGSEILHAVGSLPTAPSAAAAVGACS